MVDDEKKTGRSSKEEEKELPPSWRRIHGAIWLIGLAILAWQNWWWPGILILIAISGVTESLIRMQVSRHEAQTDATRQAKELAVARAVALPEVCPSCGSPVSADEVVWTSDVTANCPFCGSNLKAVREIGGAPDDRSGP